ncbi:DUF4870 domain-containing protein [Candidatus Parcubacteria bacterium]|nr:DUF4870 domain-containing protein [Candidatus Parcubacteria bacterium]
MSEEKKSGETKKEGAEQADNGKLAAILAYLLVGIIWFFADEKLKKNEFAKFHVKQALVLLIVSVGGSIILGFIPILGWIILPFFSIASFAFCVLGIINAAQNEKKELPFIGTYAKKLKF